jgi:pseudouridine synthase
MRLNKYIAQATGLSRRTADSAISAQQVLLNGQIAHLGAMVTPNKDTVLLDGAPITLSVNEQTILLNKPRGFVVSRSGQGSRTIYDLLPPELHHLKPIGRLDKDSSGLLLLTTDGTLTNELTHPSYRKVKVYEIALAKPLLPLHHQMINDHGIHLPDGVSRLRLERIDDGDDTLWRVTMSEGRNRQIRRTFNALGYTVRKLHRTSFGDYHLGATHSGQYRTVPK